MEPIKNFVDHLFVKSIDHMKTSRWEWPVNWDVKRQKQFLDDSLKYAEQKEFYEQCAIIRDVQQKIK